MSDVESAKTCETCRWWNTKREYISDFDETALSTCDRIHGAGGNGRRSARIYPVAASYLETARDFGCTEHEPRRTPNERREGEGCPQTPS